ncbi:hypothetical protein A2115_00935 [Candidatus Woesebacteria bacterium GWA1_41_8]|uniref:Uncharacterized protein n=1 Tax=Candidatus Woesebacteria bacterium GWA1_41_8 TaxID=1802471 RepID=A0A1F7WI99_9BACT|nr:MAG: hypothetical protein A2115_00935 [Candidatus Woesebacteria bacterium GWA1_41_8]
MAPSSDPTSPYQTAVDAASVGVTSVSANVIMGRITRCSATAPVNVTSPAAWWQVVDSDVTVVSGDIISPIPGTCSLPLCDPVFDVDGPAAFPGVPMFSGNFDFSSGVGPGTVSSTGWLADARYVSLTQYTYPFFLRLVPGDAIRSMISTASITPNYLKNQGAVSPDRYKWYFRTGDLTMRGEPTLGSDRVILFVDGDLIIDGTIDLTRGLGFFMAVSSGNITVNPGVRHPTAGEPELEGLFVADNNFITAGGTDELSIRGMVTAYGQVILNRNLSDNTQNPAEVFTYAPDLLFNYPTSLTLKRTRWKEVTP